MRIFNNAEKKIKANLLKGKINLLIGTHAVFQKDIIYKNLGVGNYR